MTVQPPFSKIERKIRQYLQNVIVIFFIHGKGLATARERLNKYCKTDRNAVNGSV